MVLSALLHLLALVVVSRWPGGGPTWTPPVPLLPLEPYVKRPLPERRPLARRRLPELTQRPLARQRASERSAAGAVAAAPAPARSSDLAGFPVPALRASTVQVEALSLPLVETVARIGPSLRAGAVGGGRGSAEQVDLSMEMLGVEALDTGQHRALVVVDPKDRRGMKGFLYLSSVHSESIEQSESSPWMARRFFGVERRVAEQEMLLGLADKMSERTQVRTEVLDEVSLDDPALQQVAFVLFTAARDFEFTRSEARNVGRYLTSGGFVFFEVVAGPVDVRAEEQDLQTLRAFVAAAFAEAGYWPRKDWHYERLEMSHPLYHSYYDLRTLPQGFRDLYFWDFPDKPEKTPDYLEGIYVGEQMVGLYSLKNYGDLWAGLVERYRESGNAMLTYNWTLDHSAPELGAYRLGVNILAYALTREGSLAQQLVSVEGAP